MSSQSSLDERLNQLEENFLKVNFDPVETLHEALADSSEDRRRRALSLIGSLPHEQFIEPLFRRAADDPSLEVRSQAVQALGSFLHQGQMADYHRTPGEDEPEFSGLPELSQQQYNAVRDFLGELVEARDWPEPLRARALPHYAGAYPEEAARHIERYYSSGRDRLVEAALKAMGRLTGSVAREERWEKIVLSELSRDQRDARRLAAIGAAGPLKIQDAGHQLVRVLETVEDTDFRQAAAESLSLLDWEEGKQHLEKFQDDPDEVVREWMEQGLARLEDRYPSPGPNEHAQPPGPTSL